MYPTLSTSTKCDDQRFRWYHFHKIKSNSHAYTQSHTNYLLLMQSASYRGEDKLLCDFKREIVCRNWPVRIFFNLAVKLQSWDSEARSYEVRNLWSYEVWSCEVMKLNEAMKLGS